MKGSISETVRKTVDASPQIRRMLEADLLNCSSYAASIKQEIEQAVGHGIGSNSIVMALRRYAAELRQSAAADAPAPVGYQIVMHTNIFDFNLEKTDTLLGKIAELYRNIEVNQREFINSVVGTNEIGIVGSEKYRSLVSEAILGEQVLLHEEDLVAVTLVFDGSFAQTPGIISEATGRLADARINLLEVVSTINELTFVVRSQDSIRAYQILRGFQNI